MGKKKRIVILGAGFGGAYSAMHLEKHLKKSKVAYEIILVNRENYFVFQPMLADSIVIRNHVIEVMEAAACNA